ncbi:MAG: T9SS type A sorting domain-containing protein [Bacteroidales bacterium]|jgi:PKD repeat protein|nr:T9SS type A sorting domain-containing protein [Bacteroidales bacterium]
MRLYKLLLFIVVILLLNSSLAFSQLRVEVREAKPLVFEINSDLKSPHQNSIFPLYAGQTVEAKIASKNSIAWIKNNKANRLISQLKVENASKSPLVFYFDTVELEDDALMYIYAEDFSIVIGPFTQKNFTDSFAFVAGPISGSAIIVQLEKRVGGKAGFILNEIGVLSKEAVNLSGFGTSGNCQVNVNCAEGRTLQRQKNGVARLLLKQGSSLFYCSGTLINNTRHDFAPLFLTANHCGKYATEEDYNQWLFHFNYEAESCETPVKEPTYYSITGAQVLSKSTDNENTGSDFKLLLLNSEVPASINPFFNGWNRLNKSSDFGHSIHHPDGDIKKISTYNSRLTSTSYGGGSENPEGKYWRVSWADTENGHGVTEGGSSGSPLFDENGLVIGALTGGLSSCNEVGAPDYYGKFSYSWESNGTSATQQLMPWLDPEFTGATSISGLGYNPDELIASFSADANALIIDQKVSFSNLSSGIITKYEWFFEGGTPDSSTKKNPEEIVYEQPGLFDVCLIVSNSIASDTLRLKNYIVVRPQIYPNPANNKFYLDFGRSFPEQLEINLFDSQSRVVKFETYRTENKLVVVPGHSEKGLHLLNVIHGENSQVFKIALF